MSQGNKYSGQGTVREKEKRRQMDPMVETVCGKKEAKLSSMCLVQIKEEKNTSLTGVKLESRPPY